MDAKEIQARIMQAIADLRMNPYDYANLTYCYILARSIIKYSTTDAYLDGLLNENLIEELRTYHIDTSGIYRDEIIVLSDFSKFLAENKLDLDCCHFFMLMAPYIVFDRAEISALFPIGQEDKLLYALYLILNRTAAYPFGKTAFTAPTLRQIYKQDVDAFVAIGLDEEGYERCWHAVHFSPLTESACSPSNKIKKAIKQYDSFGVPRQQLLSDLDALTEAKTTGVVAPSPWKSCAAKAGKSAIESSLTAEEKLFSTAAHSIINEPTTNVIHAAFYDNRDDSAIECGLVLQKFIDTLSWDTRSLIINPSPSFIANWANKVPYNIHTTFVITDDTVTSLYAKSHPNFTFIALSAVSQIEDKFDRLLILARDMPLEPLYAALVIAAPSAKIMALLPETAITLPSQRVLPHITAQDMSIYRILRIPTGVTNSQPRKKLLLYAASGEYAHCELYNCAVHTGNLIVQKKYYPIPHTWLGSTMTTQQMCNRYDRLCQNADIRHPKEPKIYSIPKEIKLYYTAQEKRNRIIGRACYRSILTDSHKNKKRGDNLTGSPIEKGLHVNSMNELLLALEKVPFYPAVNPVIMQDINKCYRGRYHELTLKTVWICCYDTLSRKVTYNHEIASFLLNSPIGAMLPHTVDTAAFVTAMTCLLPITARTGRKYWQQLNLILQTAVSEGYLLRNPVAPYWAQLQQNRASSAVEEVRAAMTRKFLYHHEILRMLAFIREENVPSGQTQKVKRYVAESKWFAGLFELFANIRISESCLLTWRDIYQIGDLEIYCIYITQALKEDGSTITYETHQYKDKCRYAPLDPLLHEMLMERYHYLMKAYHLTEEQLYQMPIILEAEPAKRFSKKMGFISRAKTHAKQETSG